MSTIKKGLAWSSVLSLLVIGQVTQLAAETSKFAYVANNGSQNVSAYVIDAITGGLTEASGSPFLAGTGPYWIAVDPTAKFVYVANQNSNNVSAFTIDSTTGALTPVSGSPFAAGTHLNAVAVEPIGRFLYVTADQSQDVSAFAGDPTTGALTPVSGSPFAAGIRPHAIAFHPSGQFIYVANIDSDNVSAYTIDVTGALTPVSGSPFAAGNGANSVAVHPAGKFAYVTSFFSNDVFAYTIDPGTGALTLVNGSPFSVGTGPRSIAVDPTGQFVYIANLLSGDLSAFAVNPTTGALTAVGGSPFPAGRPTSIAVDSSGRFAYVTDNASDDVWVYAIAPSGALSLVSRSLAGSGPISIAVAPLGPRVLNVAPASLDFGSVVVADVAELSFTITNEGGRTLTGSLSTSSPFSIVSGASFELGAGQSQVTTVRFSPTSLGSVAGDASISSNGGSASVSLTGTGIALAVVIDIKPGSFPNSINLGSGGTVPVAILSTATFDATTVDPTSVTLASAPVKLKGQGTPMASFQDVNGDGRVDLVAHVDTEALELSETDTQAVLEGRTFGGTPILGGDSVRVVP